MHKVNVALAGFAFLALPAVAGATNPPPNNPPNQQTQGQAQGQQQRQGQGQAQGQGQTQTGGSPSATANNSNTINNNGGGGWGGGPGTFPAASAYAPSYAIGSMCQEAFSIGAQAFFFGVSGGRVYTLEFCKTKMRADHFREQGRPDMAKATECKDADFRALYKETGTPCREDMPKETIAQPTSVAPQQQVLNAGGLKCFDRAGQPVALGQPGSVRCN